MTQPNAVVELKAGNGRAVRIGNAEKLTLIAGPCQMESRQHALETAHALREIGPQDRPARSVAAFNRSSEGSMPPGKMYFWMKSGVRL